jgi:hypothetical protein
MNTIGGGWSTGGNKLTWFATSGCIGIADSDILGVGLCVAVFAVLCLARLCIISFIVFFINFY